MTRLEDLLRTPPTPTRMLILLLALLLPISAPASPTSDVLDAQSALQEGQVAIAVVTLRQALADPDKVKAHTRGLSWTLLGEALLSQADAAAYAKESPRALRDLRLEALAAGYHALTQVSEESLVYRARQVVRRSRQLLFAQAVDQVRGEHPDSVSRWIDGLEALEGETLESLALRAMKESRTGSLPVALARFEAATLTADQPQTVITVPSFGHTYTEQARARLRHDPKATEPAIAVLERGLAWRVRASTELGTDHDLALRRVRRELERVRLDLLLTVPERSTEALFALEAILKDNVGNVALIEQYAPWLEEHHPTRALTLLQDAWRRSPQAAPLARLVGSLLVRRAREVDAELIRAQDADTREILKAKQRTAAREALQVLDKARALAPDDPRVQELIEQARSRLGE